MTVVATAANPRFSVSRVDIDRGGPTYTKDTLRDLQALHPDSDLYFITGADALASILSWQDLEEMFAAARFVGVSRPGYELGSEHLAACPGRTARQTPCRSSKSLLWQSLPPIAGCAPRKAARCGT